MNTSTASVSHKKITFFEELAYLFGLILIAFSVAIMTKTNFGVSMIVAPAYVIYLKVSEFLPFFTFGMSEYLFQFVLLLITVALVRRPKLSYLFSFVTAFVYGLILDLFNLCLKNVVLTALPLRIILFGVALLICGLGVALMFRTYVAPEVYELLVKEVSTRYNLSLFRFKIFYDCLSCLLALILSTIFFGWFSFVGVSIGTVICAILNGPSIGLFGNLLDRYFEFTPAIKRK